MAVILRVDRAPRLSVAFFLGLLVAVGGCFPKRTPGPGPRDNPAPDAGPDDGGSPDDPDGGVAPDDPGAPIGPGLVGVLPGIGTARDVVVDGDRVLVASAPLGLSDIDFSSFQAPQVTGTSGTDFAAGRMAARGDLAVMAGVAPSGMSHLWILDLDGPHNRPTVVGELVTEVAPFADSARGFHEVAIHPTRDLAVVAAGDHGVWTIDLNDRTAPVVIDTYTSSEWNGWAYSVALDTAGTKIYAAFGGQGLHILNLNASGQLSVAGTRGLTGTQRVVAVDGTRAFIASTGGSLLVFDVSNPASPAPISGSYTTAIPSDIAIEGTRVVTLGTTNETIVLDAFDVSDSLRPVRIGSQTVGPIGAPRGVDLSGGFAYVAAGDEGVKVYDTDLASLPLVTRARDRFAGREIATGGDLAVLLGEDLESGYAHLQVVDLSNPARPVIAGEISTTIVPGSITGLRDVALMRGHGLAIVAAGVNGLWVVDVSEPTAPRVVGTVVTSGRALAVDVDEAETRAYVADGPHGVKIFDLTNAAAPTQLGALSLPGTQRGIAVAGDYAFVSNQGGSLRIIDVSDAADPRWVGSTALSGYGFQVAADGDRAVVLSSDGTSDYVDFLDTSNPSQSPRVASMAFDGTGGVDLVGDVAVVGARNEGAVVVDVSDVANPSVLVADRGKGEIFGVALDGNTFRTAGSPAALSIVAFE